AGADYTRLLDIERDRGWQNETRQRQQDVSAPLAPVKKEAEIVAEFDAAFSSGDFDEAKRIIDQNFQVTIKYASEKLPVDYLKDAIAARHEQAELALSKMDLISASLMAAKADTSISDLAAYLRNLHSEAQQAELNLIDEYLAGGKLTRSQGCGAARTVFGRLSDEFGQRGNPL